uniref:Uncharacterized protein n=1 Tax=Timema monikensis TaxID=170555 RepID=A0A7R9HI32_9NEOP|nr:unnamed protein product [Timema monikensis]
MSVPVFTLSLGCRVLPGCVTVAKFDGSHCCLAAATIADKIHLMGGFPHTWRREHADMAALCGRVGATITCSLTSAANQSKRFLTTNPRSVYTKRYDQSVTYKHGGICAHDGMPLHAATSPA